MYRALLVFFLALPVGATSQTARLINVHILVVADSSNRISAELQVEPNINARDVMERLFKMEYMNFTKRFVVGIASFRADPKDKKFWKIEVDGVVAQVGIAEIFIKKETRLRFSVAAI